MSDEHVGILGATSLVGSRLLDALGRSGRPLTAFSRQVVAGDAGNVAWRLLGQDEPRLTAGAGIGHWLCAAPIWALEEHFSLLQAHGARRVVALSSTSRFSKEHSADIAEQELAHRLAAAEDRFRSWAEQHGVSWVILRPTLIYGLGRDKNIAEIARFIRRFGFFPLFGEGRGLRQPIHAGDVAAACIAALDCEQASNRAYTISGGETLAYREMVARVFAALGRRPRLVRVPLAAFRLGVAGMRLLPRYRHWSAAMAQRMNQDLVFDPAEARRDFGFAPRPFVLVPQDVGR